MVSLQQYDYCAQNKWFGNGGPPIEYDRGCNFGPAFWCENLANAMKCRVRCLVAFVLASFLLNALSFWRQSTTVWERTGKEWGLVTKASTNALMMWVSIWYVDKRRNDWVLFNFFEVFKVLQGEGMNGAYTTSPKTLATSLVYIVLLVKVILIAKEWRIHRCKKICLGGRQKTNHSAGMKIILQVPSMYRIKRHLEEIIFEHQELFRSARKLSLWIILF